MAEIKIPIADEHYQLVIDSFAKNFNYQEKVKTKVEDEFKMVDNPESKEAFMIRIIKDNYIGRVVNKVASHTAVATAKEAMKEVKL